MVKVIKMSKQLGDEILKDVCKLVVETVEKKITIATITPDYIDVADGYRVRLTPNYDTQCSLSAGGQGALP